MSKDFSTCPSDLTNTYKSQQYCGRIPTGKHNQAACVAPYVHISGACPQPKYKVKYIFKKRYHLLIELIVKLLSKSLLFFEGNIIGILVYNSKKTVLFERTFKVIKICLAYLTSVLRYLDLFDTK